MVFYRATILIAILHCIAALQGHAAPSMNDEQAIARVKEFAKEVGWQPDPRSKRGTKVTPPVSSQDPHRRAVWLYNIHVELDIESGKIRSAGREQLYTRRNELVVNVSESDAPKKAEGYLKAAGVSLADTRLEEATLHSISDNRADSAWHITYRRTYKGFPFLEDAIEVDVDPVDGSLLGFGDHRNSAEPADVSARLTKEQAERKGREYLAALGLIAGNTVSAEIITGGTKIVFAEPQIVQLWDMYEYWEVHTDPPLPGPATKLSWVVAYDAPWESTMVFVDAANGDILGGMCTTTPPKQNVFLSGIRASVDEIVIQPAGGKGEASHIDGKSSDAQALVKAIPAPDFSRKADCELPTSIMFTTPKRTYTFGYSAANHRLVLLTKVWNGKIIKGNLAWETTKDFEDLIAKYVVPTEQ